MTAKTRYFLVGSALVFVLGLSIGLVAYYGGTPGKLFGKQAGPAELGLVPDDAAVVAYANVGQIMKSDLRQKLRQFDGMTDEGRTEFKNETGIDIENDIEYVVAYMQANQAGTSGALGGLVLARGHFDRNRLETLARSKGAVVGQYKGKSLITPPVESAEPGEKAEPKPMAVAFLEDGLVALGSDAAVKHAIDGPAGAKSARSNADLMKLVSDVSDSSMWAVGHYDAISAQAKLPAEVTSRIPPITWFAASGHVNGGVTVMLKAETKDEQSAANLRDIVRGFVALAKMSTGNKPEAMALWPNVEMGGTGNTVSLSFGVSSQLIDVFAPKKKSPGAPGTPEKPEAPAKSQKPEAKKS